jgi:hypothetical protein
MFHEYLGIHGITILAILNNMYRYFAPHRCNGYPGQSWLLWFPESSGLPVAPIFLAFHAVPVAMDQNKILN